ncbi:hypothetical protein BDW22DRAFT_1409299 [Trametopsis cervina]|nr:hypothetical protein BDW22DRAFT_1409299 [Trametopsis cervina]
MDEIAALEALANNLALITDNPYDLSLHIQNVRLGRDTGMDDQVEAALDMVVTYWASGEEVWLPLIDMKLKSVDLDSAEGLEAVLELFERAESDYMSIPVLKRHLEFLLAQFSRIKEMETKPAELGDMLSVDWMRVHVNDIVSKGTAHLTQSHELWDLKRDWEFELLEEVPSEEKEELALEIEAALLERLKQPHSNHDETFQAYSSFTTNHKPADQYEALLVQASKSRAQAVKAYQKREPHETSLAQSGYSLEAYAYYIEFEKRGKKLDLVLLPTLYERAIAEADKRRFSGDGMAETALRTFWIGYLDLIRSNEFEDESRAKIYRRSTRSVPGSGEVWARYIRFLERSGRGDEITAAYSNALSVSVLVSDADQLVPVVLARASFERRKVEREEMGHEGYEGVLLPLLEGQSLMRQKNKAGDPRLRLEKYFSSLCLDTADLPDEAINMWSAAVRHYKTSYLTWLSYTEALIRVSMYDEARKAFRDVASKNLDWPEAIWEAWMAFEQVHGSIDDLEDCHERVQKAQKQVNARRVREAEKAAMATMQLTAEQPANVPVADSTTPQVTGARASAHGDVDMDVDQTQTESRSKRKAEDDLSVEGSKKVRLGDDRENCTVFVANLPPDTSEDDLKALFKDCGPVRETKLQPLPNALVATVEFMERDSVPAALTKDKKRIHGEEIAVHLAWQSTLYVTNFPENADDKLIRAMFGKYGTLFDVRWPSKKFKNSRRFCYVQYTSPESARAALDLHHTELEAGMRMSVLLSNPERKKERTDSDADDRELYVAGLAKSVTEADLRKLFAMYGAIKEVRMVLDDNGLTKGFAFVEFQQEKDALAALAANNHELKKRRIAVTLADTRAKAAKNRPSNKRSAEVRDRSIRIRGLPAGAQEGLLQQAIEKHARVQRVEVFQNSNEAIAELETPAEAGKLLLLAEPIVFNGQTLKLTAESLESAPPAARPGGAPAPSGGIFIPRAAGSRPRAGLGSKKARVIATPTSGAVAPTTSASTSGKGQDDFRKMLGSG